MAGDAGSPKDIARFPRTFSPTSKQIAISFGKITQRFGIEIKVAIIAIAAIVIFFQDIYITGSDAIASNYYNFVLVIPFLSAYLIYRKRKLLRAVMPLRDDGGRSNVNMAGGISSLLVALITYLYGSGTTYALDYHLGALLIFLAGSILLLFNRKTLLVLTPPLLLFIAALPSLTEFGLSFWLAMSWLSVIPAHWLLVHLLGLNVAVTLPSENIPTLLLTTASGSTYGFAVGVASSGVYSVVGFTLFAAFLGYVGKGSLWKKAVLFIAAYPLLVLINILREVILVYVANIWGDFAFNVFHATSGIALVFISIFILLLIGDRALKLDFIPFFNPALKSCDLCDDPSYKASHNNFCANCGRYLKSASRKFSSRDAYAIIGILIVSVIFVATLAPAVATASAPTKLPIQTVSGTSADALLPQVRGWNLSFVERDTYAQEALDQDAALVYNYVQVTNGTATTPAANLYVTIQVAAGGMHTPEASLVVYPVLFGYSGVKVLTDSNIQILTQPYLVGTFFVYQQQESTSAYIYWITRAAFNFGSYSDFRNVEISVWQNTSFLASSGVISSASNLSAIKQLFLPLTQSIASFWQPLSSNSVIQTIMQHWSVLFVGLAIFPALVVGGQDMDKRKGRNGKGSVALLKALTTKNRSLLESLKQSCSKEQVITFFGRKIKRHIVTPVTVEQILAARKGGTGEELSPIDALKELTYLEHIGLVRSDIVSDQFGEAIQVWRNAK
ncbi:MAG: exosortase/archaeosortase family protein [archaeon]|nr:exosortase/archaeosortase family protein [archaeon]